MAGMEEEAGGEHEQRVGAKHGRPKDGSEGGGEKKRESEAQELCSCVSVLNNHFCVRGPDTPSEDIQYSKGTGGEEKKKIKKLLLVMSNPSFAFSSFCTRTANSPRPLQLTRRPDRAAEIIKGGC